MFDILKHDDRFRYQLLSRMSSDCKYFLSYGNRNEKNLWAGNVSEQIKIMKALYNSFAEGEKPEWLSWEEILDYERRMNNE